MPVRVSHVLEVSRIFIFGSISITCVYERIRCYTCTAAANEGIIGNPSAPVQSPSLMHYTTQSIQVP
jgi:hypothetical protein